MLATQTLIQAPAKAMRITVNGALPFGCTAKDLVLAIVGKLGDRRRHRPRHRVAGPAIEALSMEGRMTVSNMTIEAGRAGGAHRAGRDDVRVPGGPPDGSEG